MRQISLLRQRMSYTHSADFWEANYAQGHTSGSGSYGALAEKTVVTKGAYAPIAEGIDPAVATVLGTAITGMSITTAAGFVPGTVGFTLGNSFATYVGWTVPWGAPVTLLGETPEQVADAQRELARIGIDRLAAAATGRPLDWADGRPLATVRLAKFGDLADRLGRQPGPAILDVRRRLEWAESHVPGATHIPLHDLPGRLADVPPGEVWVHCHSGYRAMAAASLLVGQGREAISINDHFSNAAAAGVPLEGG